MRLSSALCPVRLGEGAFTFPVPLQSCGYLQGIGGSTFPVLHSGSIHEPAAGWEQGDMCVPKVHAGGKPSTACHCGSEDPSANGGHDADNHRQMAVTAAMHTHTTVLSLCSHQGNLPVSVNKV